MLQPDKKMQNYYFEIKENFIKFFYLKSAAVKRKVFFLE